MNTVSNEVNIGEPFLLINLQRENTHTPFGNFPIEAETYVSQVSSARDTEMPQDGQ